MTEEVEHHIWRLIWISRLIEGVRAGPQVVSQEIASPGNGITLTGVGQRRRS